MDLDSKDYYAFRDKVNSSNNQDRIFEDDGEYYQMQTLKSPSITGSDSQCIVSVSIALA